MIFSRSFYLKQAMKCVNLGQIQLILAELIFERKLAFVSTLINVSFLVCHLLVALEWGSQEVPHPPFINFLICWKIRKVSLMVENIFR